MPQSTFTPLQWKNGINPKNPASFGTFTRQLADWANNTQNLLASGGAAGPAGPAGPGVPTGGTAGQVLTKNSATNYDTGWTTPASGGGAVWSKQWQAGFEGFPALANYATFATQNATPYLSFVNGSLSTFIFLGLIPTGTPFPSGMLIKLKWTGNSAGTVIWTAAYERFGIATIASDAFGSAQSVTTTAAATGILTETDITIPLANMGPSGGATAGEAFRLQINRPASGGTMASAAQLYLVSIQAA